MAVRVARTAYPAGLPCGSLGFSLTIDAHACTRFDRTHCPDDDIAKWFVVATANIVLYFNAEHEPAHRTKQDWQEQANKSDCASNTRALLRYGSIHGERTTGYGCQVDSRADHRAARHVLVQHRDSRATDGLNDGRVTEERIHPEGGSRGLERRARCELDDVASQHRLTRTYQTPPCIKPR